MDVMKRYEKLAEQIAELIRTGVLVPGEKVPSVRHASRTYGVSPSTVFQAYYLLEDRGLIQARALRLFRPRAGAAFAGRAGNQPAADANHRGGCQ